MTNGIPHRGIPFFVADDVRYNFSVYDVVRKGMPTSMRQGFDNEKYIELQAANIRKRIAQFGGKLYLEFGGKLFDDYHASRVLPGFCSRTPSSACWKVWWTMWKSSSPSTPTISKKARPVGDLGIPYDEDVLRLIDVFRSRGFLVGSVVLTQYAISPPPTPTATASTQLGVTLPPALPDRRIPARHRTHRFSTTDTARTSTSRPPGRSSWSPRPALAPANSPRA